MSFFIYPAVKQIALSFPFNILFITFFCNYFFNSKLSLILFFFQFFSWKVATNFSIKIINKICPRHNIFKFFLHENFFIPIWSRNVCKNVFMFWYFNNITNFKFRISITKVNMFDFDFKVNVFDFVSTGFFLIIPWYVLLHLLTIWPNLSINTYFWSPVFTNFIS